jgi:hypothetical protein
MEEVSGDITSAKLANAYTWAIRVLRFDDGGLLPEIRERYERLEGKPVEGPWGPSRSVWQPGIWKTEPDLVEWRSAAVPYPLLIIRGDVGALCGYVGVPPSHPFHGRSPRDVGFEFGINWAGPCDGYRIPTGEPPDCWWFGFDCAHAGNYVPAIAALEQSISDLTGAPLRLMKTGFLSSGYYVDIAELRLRTEAVAIWLFEANQTDAPDRTPSNVP